MRRTLLDGLAIPAAGTYTTTPIANIGDSEDLLLESIFDYGSGGTTAKCFLQTSLDGGETWIDVMSHAYATSDASKISSVDSRAAVTTPVAPTDGALTDNTVVNGVVGDRVRLKYIIAGTYVASTLSAFLQTKD